MEEFILFGDTLEAFHKNSWKLQKLHKEDAIHETYSPKPLSNNEFMKGIIPNR